MQANLSFQISLMSKLGGREITEMMMTAADRNLSPPAPPLTPRDAQKTARIVPARFSILRVLPMRRLAKIFQAIVTTIAVTVVNLAHRPYAGNKRQDYAMPSQNAWNAIECNMDHPIPLAIRLRRQSTTGEPRVEQTPTSLTREMFSWTPSPRQHTRGTVIEKGFAEEVDGDFAHPEQYCTTRKNAR